MLRRNVLDPAMVAACEGLLDVLDVGCGEGRFLRMLRERGARCVGVDPTLPLLDAARTRSVGERFVRALGEALPFRPESFDGVVSYVTLVDIADYRKAISEMARVLRPGGRLVVATISPFASATGGWVKDEAGNKLYFPVDRYLEETAQVLEWKGIRIVNFHRPLSAYMEAFLGEGLTLRQYLEPKPTDDTPLDTARDYERVPYGTVMVWER